MKKISTVVARQSKNFREQKLTIGLDLGDRSSWYCVLDEGGEVLLEQRLGTTPKAMKEVFGEMPRSRIALETGMHSPWVSRLLSELGHEVIVAHARNVRLIGESRRKDDRFDARTLARLARIDPQLLAPVQHRSAQAQSHLMVIRARAGLVRARTSLINTARGLTKSYGERLRGCSPRNLNAEKARQLSPELQAALEPLLAAIESLSGRIYECNQQIEKIATNSYPRVARLEQVKGVGTLIALTYMLTLEDAQRFRKSRDVGCYVGLQPGRRNSGQSEPQLHISKEGDPYLRTLLVQGAHHILGPFGADSDLRRWGLKLAERGGKNGKKRAVIATARKLAVLLHRLWVSGEAYEPLRNSRAMPLPAAQTMFNLASLLFTEGRLADSEKLNREALAIQLRVVGPENPYTYCPKTTWQTSSSRRAMCRNQRNCNGKLLRLWLELSDLSTPAHWRPTPIFPER